jgi:antirestriction protein ArdC
METKQKHSDVFAIVTDRITEQLEQGNIPWQKTWAGAGPPQNLLNKQLYHGINTLLLNMLNYEQNLFLTFNQIKNIGGTVRKGEHSHIVIFWKWPERKKGETPDEKEKKRKPMLRYYLVFNIAQCEGIPEKFLPPVVACQPHSPIQSCEEIITNMPNRPPIIHHEPHPFYHFVRDFINMPLKDTFINPEAYYDSLFHEMIHSTGHTSRLNRKEVMDEGKTLEAYSVEELTAEIGACFLNSHAGNDGLNFKNDVAYIKGWMKRLKNNKKFIFLASSKAQKAVDYILNSNEQTSPAEPEEESIHELEDISDIL